MPKAIVIGASSGIGRALSKHLSQKGYTVGITARRMELLEGLQKELPNPSFIQPMDVTQIEESARLLEKLIQEMGGVDLIILNAGIGISSLDLLWENEKKTIETNVLGFAALANVAFEFFRKQRSGHLVCISSIAALRGSGPAPAYSASKAFESNYLEGLRMKAFNLKRDIFFTDIQPGFVDTDMVKNDKAFWIAPCDKAARQIYHAIERKKKHAYITKRWRLMAWLMKIVPSGIWKRVR
ncbi:MAG: SDR family NAD(P)-dependent oxidoreductase [Chlamydiae bacterium]|nr:SDR family NAD(P)-dependent oxidoreductase [Chlamydiota bacterium]MBI3267274.1 SDR family NAD(P)-dependent oxidoreductase [Chlamydiota bacterium]